MTFVEGRFRVEKGLYLFGRYSDSVLPRNVYLEYDNGGTTQRFQVSERLTRIDSQSFLLGGGLSNRSPTDRLDAGVQFDLNAGLGFGRYDVYGLNTGERFDGGLLVVLQSTLALGYQVPLGGGFTLGVRDALTFLVPAPVGLPDKLERDYQAQGLDTTGYKLAFGTVELINQFTLDLGWSW